MPGNKDKLIPNSKRTREELSANGHKGGIASAKARKEKKDRKERASELLDLVIQGHGIEKIKALYGMQGKALTAYEVAILSCMATAISKGDAASLEKILKIAGEQFTDTLDVSVDKSEKLADIMKQITDDGGNV